MSRASVVRLFLLTLALMLGTALPADATERTPTDRWIELDLYWFQAADVRGSARRFWTRYAPLYRDVAGYKGVVLNVGMTVDYVVAFSGDLDQRIALPTGRGQELGVDIAGQLEGDTAARQQAWRARFANAANDGARTGYGAWTYRRLAELARALRGEARRHGKTHVLLLIQGANGTRWLGPPA